jgi:hypothetical protein
MLKAWLARIPIEVVRYRWQLEEIAHKNSLQSPKWPVTRPNFLAYSVNASKGAL